MPHSRAASDTSSHGVCVQPTSTSAAQISSASTHAPCAWQMSAIRSSSWRRYTCPVGLCGFGSTSTRTPAASARSRALTSRLRSARIGSCTNSRSGWASSGRTVGRLASRRPRARPAPPGRDTVRSGRPSRQARASPGRFDAPVQPPAGELGEGVSQAERVRGRIAEVVAVDRGVQRPGDGRCQGENPSRRWLRTAPRGRARTTFRCAGRATLFTPPAPPSEPASSRPPVIEAAATLPDHPASEPSTSFHLRVRNGSWRGDSNPQPAVYKTAADRPRRPGEWSPGSSGRAGRPASALQWGRVAPGGMTSGMTSGINENEELPESGCSTGGGGMVGSQVPEGSQPPGELAQPEQDR